MLRCVPSTLSPEIFPEGSSSDMSVLERQRAVLQRLLYNQQEIPSDQSAMSMFQYSNTMMNNSPKIHQSLDDISPNFGFACSGITSASVELDQQQQQRCYSTTVSANSSRDHRVASTKKRKAEMFDAEEESKAKMLEGEAGEAESGIMVKIKKENSGKTSKANSKASELASKSEYIHVRARRGQATDSHSLAERARREKITKKMKCLQELVPGCDKVIGKAGMLDEIINYVQSLQKQVEFLSMKLGALNPTMEFNMDNLFAKELPAYVASFPPMATPAELMNSSLLQYNQGSQLSAMNLALNTAQMTPQKAVENYLDSITSPQLQQVQQATNWENDWQSIYNIGLH